MKDLKFDNQRGASMACDLVDVVRCRDCEYWMKKPDGVRGACLLLSKLIDREYITGCNEFCFSGTKKVVKMEWISVKDRLPEPETEVFIYAEVRRDDKVIGCVTTTAIYEDGTIHTEESIWTWDDINYWGTYDEETDDYIIPEGWWEERHYNDDDTRNLQVDDFVTHWMPLPDAPEVVSE